MIKSIRVGDENSPATIHPKWDSVVSAIDRAFGDEDRRMLATYIVTAHLLGDEDRKQQLLQSADTKLAETVYDICARHSINLSQIAAPPTQPQ